MKRFRFILLLAALLAAGFPALAQENDTRMTVQEREQETRIKIIENRMIIEHLPKEAILEIYNIMGVKVYSRRLPPGTGEYLLNLPKGYYILKIGKITKKIAIR